MVEVGARLKDRERVAGGKGTPYLPLPSMRPRRDDRGKGLSTPTNEMIPLTLQCGHAACCGSMSRVEDGGLWLHEEPDDRPQQGGLRTSLVLGPPDQDPGHRPVAVTTRRESLAAGKGDLIVVASTGPPD